MHIHRSMRYYIAAICSQGNVAYNIHKHASSAHGFLASSKWQNGFLASSKWQNGYAIWMLLSLIFGWVLNNVQFYNQQILSFRACARLLIPNTHFYSIELVRRNPSSILQALRLIYVVRKTLLQLLTLNYRVLPHSYLSRLSKLLSLKKSAFALK